MTADSGDARRIIWYTRVVSVVLIIVCNGFLVLGWWLSGVDLETSLSKPEIYDVKSHYCVGVKWMKIDDVDQPMKVCTAWLDLSDPSGQTHTLRQGHPLTVGADGELHYADQRNEDYRLIALVIFVMLVFGAGMWVKQYMIARYTRRLQNINGKIS